MSSVNKVFLLGNLTRDPEVRYTPKGTAVAEFGIALNTAYTTGDGEKREKTTFVDVTLWGRTAEIASEYVKKGHQLHIEGHLDLDQWDDKQTGQKRSKLKVTGEQITLIGGRRDKSDNGGDYDGDGGGQQRRQQPSGSRGGSGQRQAPQQQRQQPPPQRPKPPADPDLDPPEDDIPF